MPDNLEDVLVDPGWASALYKAASAQKALKSAKDKVPTTAGSVKLRRSALNRSGQANTQRLGDLIKRAKESGNRQHKEDAAAAILTNALAPNAR